MNKNYSIRSYLLFVVYFPFKEICESSNTLSKIVILGYSFTFNLIHI